MIYVFNFNYKCYLVVLSIHKNKCIIMLYLVYFFLLKQIIYKINYYLEMF